MAHSYWLQGLLTWRYQVRISIGSDICHRGCAYTVFQTVQRHVVYSAVYGTMQNKEPLKSFEIRVGHSPGFGRPSVAILPCLCRVHKKERCTADSEDPAYESVQHRILCWYTYSMARIAIRLVRFFCVLIRILDMHAHTNLKPAEESGSWCSAIFSHAGKFPEPSGTVPYPSEPPRTIHILRIKLPIFFRIDSGRRIIEIHKLLNGLFEG